MTEACRFGEFECEIHLLNPKRADLCDIGLAALRHQLDQYERGSAEQNCCPLHPQTMLSDHCAACVDAQALVIRTLRATITTLRLMLPPADDVALVE